MLYTAIVIVLALAHAVLVEATDGTCSGTGANPLVYNFAVGGYPAKVINDQQFAGPPPGLFLEDPAVLSRALARRFLNSSVIGAAFNVLYIEKDGEGLLIDTGLGLTRGGRLFQQLETEGISLDSIKHILLTHAHGDHIGGLILDPTAENPVPAFPSATVYVSRIEYEYWTTDPVDSGTTLRSAENQANSVRGARAAFAAVQDNLVTFETDEEPIPGFMPILTPFHTPGSVSYTVADGDSRLLVTGDAVNHRILTIENPWVNTSMIDFDREAGPAGRYALLDMAAKYGWQLFSFHSEFPGLMNVENFGVNFLTHPSQYRGTPEATAVCI